MLKKIFIASILFCAPLFCLSQSNAIDSLKKLIEKSLEDSNKVKYLIDLSGKYRFIPPPGDTLIFYANQAKELAEKINYPWGLGYALKSLGLAYGDRSEYVKALVAWKEALRIFQENNIKAGEANILSNIAFIYYSRSLEDSALDYDLRALKIAEEIKDSLRINTVLNNIVGVYSNKPITYDKAFEYQRKALLISIARHDTGFIATSYANLGEMFIQSYLAKRDSAKNKNVSNEELDSALIYLTKAKVFPDKSNLLFTLNRIGKTYLLKKEFTLAEQYYRQSYDSSKVQQAKNEMATALLGIAQTDTAKGDLKDAISVYIEAEKMYLEIGLEETYDIQYVYEGLTKCYSELKDYGNAFHYQSLLVEVKKKIYDLDTDKKLANKLFKFEMGKSQAEVELQKAVVGRQKLIRNGFIGGFAVVLMFAGVFFTQRNRISKEKKRSDELLLNILPEETAEELKLTGTAQAKSFDLVSVLFTDFKNFTQASENLTPKELVAEINFCYCEFDKIITKYGLEKIKTIGDAYMCAGGLPVPNTTHPVDIVKAGLEMVLFIEKNKQERIQKGLPFFELRCGIHTGPVVAGIVGIKKFAYDIWGDTVNTASRMESSGEIGKVNVSGETYELIKNNFKCTYRGKVKAKNKGEIDMYFVEGVA